MEQLVREVAVDQAAALAVEVQWALAVLARLVVREVPMAHTDRLGLAARRVPGAACRRGDRA